MIIFRPHRSSLDETNQDRIFKKKSIIGYTHPDDVEKMKEYIVELWNRKWHGSQKLFTTDDIVINKESAVNDDRIGWEDSMYVCVKRMGSEDYIKEYGVPQCIGICATKYKK